MTFGAVKENELGRLMHGNRIVQPADIREKSKERFKHRLRSRIE